MNRFIRMAPMAIMVAILVGMLAQPSANATAPPAPDSTSSNDGGSTSKWDKECLTEGSTETCSEVSSHSSSKTTSTVIAEAKSKGRIVGEYLASGGLTRQQVKGKRCSWMSGGYNTIRKSNGQIVKYKDNRRQYVCRTGKGPSGYQVKKCGNTYWPKGRKPSARYKTVRNPVVIRSFNNWTLEVAQKVSTVTESKSSSSSVATCPSGQATGSGYAFARSAASTTLRFKARGRSAIQAQGRQARVRHELSLNVSAYSKVYTEASTEAKSTAKCSGGTTPPPPAEEKPWVQIGQKNDVDVSNTAQVCADYNVPSGTVPLRFATKFGSYPGGNVFSVSGSGTKCTTYRAPSEVPAGGKDTLTALIGSSTSSTDIVINAAAAHPN